MSAADPSGPTGPQTSSPQPKGPQPKGRASLGRLLAAVAVLILLAAGVWGWQIARAPQQVASEILKPAPVSLVLALNGRTAAQTEVEIKSAVVAHAEQVLVAEGDMVRKGQPLITLDATLVEAQRDQAEAALKVQEARRAQAESAERRAKELGLALSKSDLESAELDLAIATGEVIRLKAALAEVEQQLTRYHLSAPLDGVVLERDIDPGQLVGTEESLLLIADPQAPLVETDVEERYAGRLKLGAKVLLQPVGQDTTLSGQLTYLAPRIDLTTGGRAAKIRFDQPVDLPLGLTVAANIIVEDHAAALTLPRAALHQDGGVLTIENGRAVAHHVTFIDWTAERLILTSGLEAGAVVITQPQGISPGAAVSAATQPAAE